MNFIGTSLSWASLVGRFGFQNSVQLGKYSARGCRGGDHPSVGKQVPTWNRLWGLPVDGVYRRKGWQRPASVPRTQLIWSWPTVVAVTQQVVVDDLDATFLFCKLGLGRNLGRMYAPPRSKEQQGKRVQEEQHWDKRRRRCDRIEGCAAFNPIRAKRSRGWRDGHAS